MSSSRCGPAARPSRGRVVVVVVVFVVAVVVIGGRRRGDGGDLALARDLAVAFAVLVLSLPAGERSGQDGPVT